MKKKTQKIINYIVIAIIFCLIGILIGNNLNQKDENKKVSTNKAVGVYHSNNWNNRGSTLTLNEDFSCSYPSSSDVCEWTITDKKITITLTYYQGTLQKYNNKEMCEEKNERLKKEDPDTFNDFVEMGFPSSCEEEKSTHEAILVDDGVILHNILFKKVG